MLDMILMAFVHVILMVSFLIFPYITRKDVIFGVRMPTSAYMDSEVVRIRKQFIIRVLLVGLVFVAAQFFGINESQMLFLVLAEVVVYTTLFVLSYKAMLAYKATKNYKRNNQRVVDTEFRHRQLTIHWSWYIAYLAVIIITGLVAAIPYDSLPDMLVVSYQSNGETSMMAKGPAILFLMAIQVLVLLLMIGVQYIIRHAKQELYGSNPQKSIEQNVQFRYRFSIILYVLGLLIGLIFLLSMLLTVGIIKDPNVILITTLILTFVPVGVIFVYSVKYRQDGSSEAEDSDVIQSDDDAYWKLGMFYYNPNDPSLFVAKRAGVGWTVNHAKWQTWLIYAGIIAAVVASFTMV